MKSVRVPDGRLRVVDPGTSARASSMPILRSDGILEERSAAYLRQRRGSAVMQNWRDRTSKS